MKKYNTYQEEIFEILFQRLEEENKRLKEIEEIKEKKRLKEIERMKRLIRLS